MTNEQINAAIAEACGWTDVDGLSAKGLMGKPPESLRSLNYIPDYCNDLNAMHEAEKVLTSVQCVSFKTHLRDPAENYPASGYFWHATARQRAEAFLRTLGKWEEVQK